MQNVCYVKAERHFELSLLAPRSFCPVLLPWPNLHLLHQGYFWHSQHLFPLASFYLVREKSSLWFRAKWKSVSGVPSWKAFSPGNYIKWLFRRRLYNTWRFHFGYVIRLLWPIRVLWLRLKTSPISWTLCLWGKKCFWSSNLSIYQCALKHNLLGVWACLCLLPRTSA